MSVSDSIESIYDTGKPWRTLFRLYRPQRRWVIGASIAYLFKASPVWVLPVITANIIDLVVTQREGGLSSLGWNAGIGALFILQNIPTAYLYTHCLSRAIRNVEKRLRSELARRLQMLSIAYHSDTSTGRLQTKVLRDVESVEQMSRQLVDSGQFAVLTILIALAVTAWRLPAFVPVFLLFVPVAALVHHSMSQRLKRYNEVFRQRIEGMNTVVLGMLNMIPVTRAHAAEEDAIARIESRLGEVSEAGQRFDRHAGLFGSTSWVSFMLLNLTVLVTGAWLSHRGTLPITAGDLVLLTGYFNAMVMAVMQLSAMLPTITKGFDGLRSMGEVIECPDIEENRGKRSVSPVSGKFDFEHVSFGYRSADDTRTATALNDVHFSVSPGETIGIVGASGSGKSTLMSLIVGFHRPTAGRILLDGVDMNQIDLRTYRRHLAVVGQETILFEGSLRENILYGAKHPDEARLLQAVKDANANEFIQKLPLGLDTQIGERGARLSGGQRQRIAIARALMRDPRVLILDEATSALDGESEALVKEALDRLMLGRTTFIVAHRLGTLEKADRILTLEAGQLVAKPQVSHA